MSSDKGPNEIPQREAGATLDAPDQAEVIMAREALRAAYEEQRERDA